MGILFAGYTYIRDGYRKTFSHYPDSDQLFFLLPHEWKARGGKVVFKTADSHNIFKTKIFFFHSHYPVIGGLLKGWMPAFPLIVRRLKRDKHLKLVFSFSEPTILVTLYNGLWAKFFGLKFIMFSWENVAANLNFKGFKGFIRKIIVKINLFLADGLICGNRKGKNIYSKLTVKPIVVIPPFGLDSEFFKREPKEKHFDGYNLSDNIVFTFAGAIAPRKGIPGLLEAFKDVVAAVPNVRLVLVGNDETEGEIDRLIKEKYELGNHVLLKKWLSHDQLRDLLSVSDVFVYPSVSYKGWEEQFGYSMAEASLMELPVISTRLGSIEDVVISGKTGILVKPGNVSELSQSMISLAKNDKLRKELGQNGRQFIIYKFSQQIIAAKFYNFFNLLLNGRQKN